MIDPQSVMIVIPAFDGKIECATAKGLYQIAAVGMAKGVGFVEGISNIALVRNIIANNFLREKFDWLVCIDADIGFSADDFALMMDWAKNSSPPVSQKLHDAATLLELELKIAGPKLSEPRTVRYKTPALVACEYSRKEEGAPPIRLGLGFARIHRSVFTELDKLTLESGEARIDQFMYHGQLVSDYFLCGCTESRWLGEDTGFFSLCRMAGIHPRVEQRTQLVHVGKAKFPYPPIFSGAQ